MKKITLKTNTLLNAVAKANSFTSNDGSYAGQIVLSGKDGKLTIKAGDMVDKIILQDIDFISSDLTDADVAAFSIEGKKLLAVLKNAKTDDILIELHSGFVYIKSARSRIKIETLASVQHIEIVMNKQELKTLELSNKINDFRTVLHALAINNAKFELNGVLLQVKEGIMNIVATDTRRLSNVRSSVNTEDVEVIIPRRGIETIVKLFGDKKISTEIDGVNLSVYTDDISFQTRLTNGKFPQWEKIMPNKLAQTLSINRVVFKEMLEEASIFNNEIIIDATNEKLTIQDMDRNTNVEYTYENEEYVQIRFGANAKFLIDFLNSCIDEEIEIGFNGVNKAVLLTANSSYSEACMPITIDEIKEVQADEQSVA